MVNKKNLAVSFLVIVFMTFMIFRGDVFFEGVRNGLILSSEVLIPSIFPFMIVAAFAANPDIIKIISFPLRPLAKILKISNKSIGIYFLSLIGGYLAGTVAIKTNVENRDLDKKSASYLLCFCINASPAFLVTYIGSYVLKSFTLGVVMLVCQLIASMFLVWIVSKRNLMCKKSVYITVDGNSIHSPKKNCEKNPSIRVTNIKDESIVKKSSKKKVSLAGHFVMSVCDCCQIMIETVGFVIIFSCVAHICSIAVDNNLFSGVFTSFLEITNGAKTFSCISSEFIKQESIALIMPLLLCFLTSFGGICVLLQVYVICKKTDINVIPMMKTRFFFACFSSLLMFIVLKILPCLLKIEYSDSLAVWASPNNTNGELFAHTPLFTIILLCMCVILIVNLDRKREI